MKAVVALPAAKSGRFVLPMAFRAAPRALVVDPDVQLLAELRTP